jgi:hypothetical protein
MSTTRAEDKPAGLEEDEQLAKAKPQGGEQLRRSELARR